MMLEEMGKLVEWDSGLRKNMSFEFKNYYEMRYDLKKI